jgi:hypothetical protein
MSGDVQYAAYQRAPLGGWRIGGSRIMDRRARQRKARLLKRDSVRQTLAVIAAGSLLGVSLFATGEYITAKQRASAQAAALAAAKDDEIYTGSILYMPVEGRTCHQLLFDNLSGRFTDNGNVDCINAAYRSASEPKQWSAARVRVISTNFHDH